MKVRPQLVLLVLFLALGATARQEDALFPRSNRIALRGIATSLSKLGRAEEVARVHDVLMRAGDDADDLAKLKKTWDKNLEREARGNEKSVVRKLRSQAADLSELSKSLEDPARTRLAELVLELDSEDARANGVVGRVLHEGRWITDTELERLEDRRRVAELVQEAHRYALDVEIGPSDSPVFAALFEEEGVRASASRVTVHARLDAAKLARILRQALRALALSNVLVTDVLTVPPLKNDYQILLMDTEQAYDDALAEARDNGGLSREEYDRNVSENMRSFVDRRGWRTSRWRTEADYQALVLWVLIEEVLGHPAQPCLVAGHLNWLTLNFLGTTMPIVTWREASSPDPGTARTTAKKNAPFQTEALWRSARRTLFGCRSWMVHRVLEGRDPPWSRSLVDHVGKVTDENLLKSTLVVDYLHETGEFEYVLDATREGTEPIPAFEAALDATLPEFDELWRAWLLGDEALAPGLVQGLEASPAAGEDPELAALLGELNRLRRRAFDGQFPEFETVAADVELSAGALAHARYLGLNEEQKSAWPDAHEEYAGREGFSAAGSRAGLNGVVAFTDDPIDALEQWMATFYHRLPLLHPGMFGIGFGLADGVAVLDVTSLVLQPWRDHWVMWPADGLKGVPRAFVPELPNPVPGEDQSAWGYPITLQVFLPAQDRVLEIGLELFEGGAGGRPVDCFFISPAAPHFPELAPRDAWCLIPKTHLKSSTRYTIVAEIALPAETRSWNFETE